MAKQVVYGAVHADVQHIQVPTGLGFDKAAKALMKQHQQDEMEISVYAEFPGHLTSDVLLAIDQALIDQFGLVNREAKMTFFGPQPPTFMDVPIDYGKKAQVPTGCFSVPLVEGQFEIQFLPDKMKDKVVQTWKVALTGDYKQKHRKTIDELVNRITEILDTQPNSKGKVFQLRLTDSLGEPVMMPMPEYMKPSGAQPEDVIVPYKTLLALDTYIWNHLGTPLQMMRDFKFPIKRGVLLYGTYGTGKSMSIDVAAGRAVQSGWTVVKVVNPVDLDRVLEMTKRLDPVVVIVEDLDKALAAVDDAAKLRIVNAVSDVNGNSREMFLIGTTNHLEDFPEAMYRSGRLDALIEMPCPDQDTAGRLIKLFLAETYDHDSEVAYKQVTEILGDGTWAPAFVKEICETARMTAISQRREKVTDSHLLALVEGKRMQHELAHPKPVDLRSPEEKAAAILGTSIEKATEQEIKAYTTPLSERFDTLEDLPPAPEKSSTNGKKKAAAAGATG